MSVATTGGGWMLGLHWRSFPFLTIGQHEILGNLGGPGKPRFVREVPEPTSRLCGVLWRMPSPVPLDKSQVAAQHKTCNMQPDTQ